MAKAGVNGISDAAPSSLREASHVLQAKTPDRDQPDWEFDRFFALSHDLMSIIGFDGSIRCVNLAFERTLGLSADELLAELFLDVIHPDDHGVVSAEMRKLRAGAHAVDFEVRCRWKYGLYRWIQWNASCSPSGRLVYAVGRDITGRKRADDNPLRLQAQVHGRTQVKHGQRESWELLATEGRRLKRAQEAHCHACLCR